MRFDLINSSLTDDHAALSGKSFGMLEVGEIGGFVSVDEDEIEGRIGGDVGESLECRADD